MTLTVEKDIEKAKQNLIPINQSNIPNNLIQSPTENSMHGDFSAIHASHVKILSEK